MKIYRQTTMFTCGPSCAMMILNHFFGEPMNKRKELEFWKEMMAIPFKCTLPLSLSVFLLKRGLKVELISKKMKMNRNGCGFFLKDIKPGERDVLFKIFNTYYNRFKIEDFRKYEGKWLKKNPKIKELPTNFPCAVLIDSYVFDVFLDTEEKMHVPDWILLYNNTVYSSWYGKIEKMPAEVIQNALDSTWTSFGIQPSVLVVRL